MVVGIPIPRQSEKIKSIDLPIIDLKKERWEASKLIVKACEEYGFFKVINHGIPMDVITKMDEESLHFFAKPASEKLRAGPANPLGYGCKNIGSNGDTGGLEYLLLHSNPIFIAKKSESVSNDPENFSSNVTNYIEAVGELACELLELMAEGLGISDTSVFSKLIRVTESDSLLRLNHYPPALSSQSSCMHSKVGFGEHSDPQILTILRSNGVDGLQIFVEEGVWAPISPEPPTAFCVNVGDLLQVMTNGRFGSVRHRALTNSNKSRMSMAFFGAPPINEWVCVPPEMVTNQRPCLYRPFTWGEYKKTAYSLRLGESRLNLFRVCREVDDDS